MNNYISVEVFIENDVSGDWGKEFPDEKHKTKVFCVRGADINDLNIGKIENLPVRYVKEASKDKFLEKGNIIIEISGGSPTQSTGRVAFLENIDREVVCSNFCRALKIKKEYSPKYVFYLLQNIYNSGVFFNFESKTSGIKNLLYNSAFENIKVPNQDYSSQQKIENVITVIDKKIQLLHQINDNLAELAKTIYDYWFVQFDFPDENGKPYKSSGGKMVYNNVLKREIPEGWEVDNIFNVASIQYGFPFSTEFFNENKIGVPVIRIRDIKDNQISNFSTEEKIDSKYIIKKGEILIGMDGNFHINYWANDNCYLNQRVVKIQGIELSNIYLKEQIEPYIKTREKSISRTTVGHLSDKDLRSINIIIPNNLIMIKINSFYNNTLNKFIENLQQIQHLQSLRDWLLPMLMNGQISVE